MTHTLDKTAASLLSADEKKIIEARHHDPFMVLGRHHSGQSDKDQQETIRVFQPHCQEMRLGAEGPLMQRRGKTDLFSWSGPAETIPRFYSLHWKDSHGLSHVKHDPYSFEPQLAEFDLHLFGEGRHWHLYRVLGAHEHEVEGIRGILFATWAPNAERVSVVGDFNQWDGRCHPMRSRGGSGVWELFIPELQAGALYKFELRNRDSGQLLTKTDPYAQQYELRPDTAAVVRGKTNYDWQDSDWQQQRQSADWLHRPISVYEVHLGSWQRDDAGQFLNYRELAHQLVSYVTRLGFTHIELLPITEHPLDASWGYQATGYFAPTRRFGQADDFRYFVDLCHQQGIGVLLDWVPAHFPKDDFALARFDGSALYEHEDPRRGEHRDWGTLIYNFGRNEVKNFLLASALFWLEEFHIDGLRVDAVASMLYLDYSREADDWVPNIYGGNENLEAIEFLRELNIVAHERQPGTMIIAEESTAWPQVTRPTWLGGLGFSMKWNMGWMHDTLDYLSKDPVHRHYHHDRLTFGLLYLFSENFMLPFSHDEVVHGKKSMLYKMPGDEWQRFANLRLLYTYMFLYPGKKLLFMGNEFAQGDEWNFDQTLDWYVTDYPLHQGVQQLIGDLNHLYRDTSALYQHEFETEGFEWIDCHDADQSILSFLRRDGDEHVIVILNFTPVPRSGYRIGVPDAAFYEEVLNSDSGHYGGSNTGNAGGIAAEATPWMGRPHSVLLDLPPLAAVVLQPRRIG
ncbi:MAG: 1,4-alpha-glucan branching protein GlgB [Gammaproteobacteria bacterium]|nr:1,4-alpha-glucan branching protein GlgB [Gammaproteobacteria bacterium]MCF6260272.1 1,4-alpha-glucan branching protein GlgB [Gammaproteobacteria bacterium]